MTSTPSKSPELSSDNAGELDRPTPREFTTSPRGAERDRVVAEAEQMRAVARELAARAIEAQSSPVRFALRQAEFRLLSFLGRQSWLLPDRVAKRFANSAAKRDARAFLDLIDGQSDAPVIPAGPVAGIGQRSSEFRPHDPPKVLDPDPRLIAFYLPQFHPFAENDEWWGKGFTEWTNVGKALPVFPGHHQPHCPIHLGYYDLRVPSVMEEQAKLARQYGISGFSYYFYWFGGRTLMETPLRAMLANPSVDIPFCLTWANENWTRRWDGLDDQILIQQNHSIDDSRALLRHLGPYFRDPRHIMVDGCPVFLVYRAKLIPDIEETVGMWREEARKMGLKGLHLVTVESFEGCDPLALGFDAAVEFPPHGFGNAAADDRPRRPGSGFRGQVHDYRKVVDAALARAEPEHPLYRGVMLSWDNTARRGDRADIFANFSVAEYRRWLTELCRRLRARDDIPPDRRLVFVNAWNEWAEGTHLEPDQRYGYAYLAATAEALGSGRD